MPKPSVYVSLGSNIAKVESRSKVYFDYAETKAYIMSVCTCRLLSFFYICTRKQYFFRAG